MADTFTISQSLPSNTITLDETDIIIDGTVLEDHSPGSPPWDYGIGTDDWFAMAGRGGGGANNSYWRMFYEWDLSEIPDNSTIDIIRFLYLGLREDIDCHVHEMLGTRPSSSVSEDIWTECGEGTIYADVAGFPVDDSNQILSLGESSTDQACVDLQSQLSLDWFAIGIQSDNESNVSQSWIGTSERIIGSYKPSLYIEYTTNETITLTQPNKLYFGSIQKLEKHVFPDGSFKRYNVGDGGKVITLVGTETSGEADMNTLDQLRKSGYPVTIAGLDHDELNTTWYISNFKWNKQEAYVDRYDWNLELVEDA